MLETLRTTAEKIAFTRDTVQETKRQMERTKQVIADMLNKLGDCGKKKPEGAPTASPSPTESAKIDPCLIGTWTASSVKDNTGMHYAGGTGFKVTFTSDGRETVDYSGMQRLTWANGDGRLIYTGRATAVIEAKDGSAKIDRIENAGVTFTGVFSVADAAKKTKSLPDLGIGGLPSGKGTGSYTCSGDTLVYKASHAFASDLTVTLTRAKQ